MESSQELPSKDNAQIYADELSLTVTRAIRKSGLPMWLVLMVLDSARAEVLSVLYQTELMREGGNDAEDTGSTG